MSVGAFTFATIRRVRTARRLVRPTPPPLTPVTVQLSWLHQAQFAGLHAAGQLGYFAAEGLQVLFVESGP